MAATTAMIVVALFESNVRDFSFAHAVQAVIGRSIGN
jgi:hypothetical protein